MMLDQSETFLDTSGVTRFMNHRLAHYCLLRARAVGYPAAVRAIFAVGLRHRMMLRCAVERSRDIYMLAQLAGVAEKGSD